MVYLYYLVSLRNNATFTEKLLQDFVVDSCGIMQLEERSAAVAHKLSAAASTRHPISTYPVRFARKCSNTARSAINHTRFQDHNVGEILTSYLLKNTNKK
jgi:hypothetical protein